jgi:hypothetical protein
MLQKLTSKQRKTNEIKYVEITQTKNQMKTNTYLLLIHSKQQIIKTITTITGESRHLLQQKNIQITQKQVGVSRKKTH